MKHIFHGPLPKLPPLFSHFIYPAVLNTWCAGPFKFHFTELIHYSFHKRPPEQLFTLKYHPLTECLSSGSWEVPGFLLQEDFLIHIKHT